VSTISLPIGILIVSNQPPLARLRTSPMAQKILPVRHGVHRSDARDLDGHSTRRVFRRCQQKSARATTRRLTRVEQCLLRQTFSLTAARLGMISARTISAPVAIIVVTNPVASTNLLPNRDDHPARHRHDFVAPPPVNLAPTFHSDGTVQPSKFFEANQQIG